MGARRSPLHQHPSRCSERLVDGNRDHEFGSSQPLPAGGICKITGRGGLLLVSKGVSEIPCLRRVEDYTERQLNRSS